jgi:hypothetical protein
MSNFTALFKYPLKTMILTLVVFIDAKIKPGEVEK